MGTTTTKAAAKHAKAAVAAGKAPATVTNICEWYDEHDAPFHLALAYLRLFHAENAVRRVTGSDAHAAVQGVTALRLEVWDRLYDRTSTSERDEAIAHARQFMEGDPS